MDSNYLQDLWNWSSGQDPTLKERYTFDSWSRKLESDGQYRQRFYDWIGDVDPTHDERRPYLAWERLVTTPEEPIKKKEESVSESGEETTLSDIPGVGEVSLTGFTRGSRYDAAPVGATPQEVEAAQIQREQAMVPTPVKAAADQYVKPGFDREKEIEEAREEFQPTLDLYSGVENLYGNLVGVIPTVYDMSVGMQNDLADALDLDWLRASYSDEITGLKDIRDLQQKFYEHAEYYKGQQRKYNQNITESIKSGRYMDALEQTFSAVLQSTPDLLLSAASGAGVLRSGLGVLATTQAVNRYDEIRDNNNMSGLAKTSDAILYGTAEAVFEELFGTAQSAKILKNIIKKEGKEKASTIIKKGINEFYEKAAKKYPLFITPLGEGFSELGTQVSQNVIAKYSGADPDRNIMDGASDAFIVGAAMGGGFGALNATAKQVASSRTKKEIDKDIQKITELEYILKKTEGIPEDVKQSITTLKDNLTKRVKTSLTTINSEFSKLDEDQQNEFIRLKRRLREIDEQYEAAENDTIKEALNSEAKEVRDKIKNISTYAVQEQSTDEVSVQPDAAVSEEVEEGVPETKPEELTEQEEKEKELESLEFEEATTEDDIEYRSDLVEKSRKNAPAEAEVVRISRDDSGNVIAGEIQFIQDGETVTEKIRLAPTEQGTRAPIEGTKLRDNIKKAVSKVFTKTDSRSFKNGKDMAAYAKSKYNIEVGENEGARVFVKNDGSIEVLVNEELADDTSFGHEVWHAVLLKSFGDNQKKFTKFRKSINKTLRNNGYAELADNLDEFANQYEETEVPAEEYLAQLGGILTAANIDVANLTEADKTLLQQIKEIVNNIMVELTGEPVFLEDATPKDILNFMSTMSGMMARGEDISGLFADEAGRVIDEGDVTIDTTRPQKKKFENNEYEVKQKVYNPESGKAQGFTFIADRMATGVWRGLNPESGIEIKLMGGIGYPMLKNLFGKAGWAVDGGAIMSSFINKIVKSKTGIGFPVIMSEYAHVSNLTFSKIFEAEMKWMVDNGEITEQEQLENVNNYISKTLIGEKNLAPIMKLNKEGNLVDRNTNAPLRAFAIEKNGTYTPKVYNSMSEVYKELEGTFAARASFMKVLIGEGLKNRYHKINMYKFPDMVRVADEVADKRLKGVPSGVSVSAIQFDQKKAKEFAEDISNNKKLSDNHSAEAVGVDKHISYEYVVEGKSLGWLPGVIEMSEAEGVSPETKEWYEEQREKYKEGEISEAQLRSNVTSKSRASMPEVILKTRAQKTLKEANEDFGIEDGEENFKTRAQKINAKETKDISSKLQLLSDSSLEDIKSLINKGVKEPKKTKKAYKLFKVKKQFPGELFPLFVGANESVTTGKWIEAKPGELKKDPKTGKIMVKSTLGPLAYRPGWHSGNIAVATHIGAKKNKTDKAPSLRAEDQVWAEVEVGDDVNWQKIATERAEKTKDGRIKVGTAHITDQIPLGGSYNYKTNSNMTGSWIISGEMKVNRVLTDSEVSKINKTEGAKDLPREKPFDFELYGFNENGTPKDKKKVISNQIARAYQVAKETGENTELVKAVEDGVKTRAQKKASPERMQKELDGVIEKARKRGADKQRVYDDALAYLQGSKVYEEADDVAREKMVRDLNKKLGVKEKRVPKIFATRKNTDKVTVNEKKALLNMIRAQAKAAKNAASAQRAIAKDLNDELKMLFKKGFISTRQMKAIINKALSLNFFNDDHVVKFVEYVEKVYNNAEYAENLKNAESIKRKIKRFTKNKDLQAETRDIAKRFLEIEPFFAENIEEYLKIANQILEATSTTVGKVAEGEATVNFKQAMDYGVVTEYTDKALAFQEKIKKEQLLRKNNELVESGVLSSEMSLEEIKEIIKALEEDPTKLPPQEKQKMIMDFVKKYYESYKTLLNEMIRTQADPFTGERIFLTQEQIDLVKRFMKIDLDTLSLKDAFKIVESIDNFIVNQNTDGMLGSVEAFEGANNAKIAKRQGFKARRLRTFFSKKFGRTWAEEIEQLPLLINRIFGGESSGAKWDKLSGLSDLMAVKNKAFTKYNKYVENYSKQFEKIKDFNSLENIFSRAMLAYVSRASQGSKIQQDAEFKKRKKNIEVTISAMKKNGTDRQKKDAKVLEKVYKELIEGANTAQEVSSRSSKTNRLAVSYWQAAFSDIFDDMQRVSRGVYNTILERDFKYTPDTYSAFGSIKESEQSLEQMMNSSSFFGINDKFDTKESGTMMKATKPELQENPARIVSFDFDSNMARALQSAIIDIETAPLIRKIDAFYKSQEVRDIIEEDDLKVLRQRIAGYIKATKRKDFQRVDELGGVARAINYISTFAASRALGGLAQIPKQTIPVIANTLINSGGRTGIADVLSAKEFIDKSGYAIGLRGIASQADIQTMNKILKRAEESTGMKALNALKELNQWYLEKLVARPDVFVARASWIAYYKQNLDKQGLDTKIDWDTHTLNKEAADYAQRSVDKQQNYSDADLAGNFLRSKNPTLALTRKTLFPFATFMLNKRSALIGDVSTLQNKLASKEDKRAAASSLMANAAEMAIFHQLSIFIASTIYGALAGLISGGDEEEETRKAERELKGKMYRVKNVVNEYISPVPGITDESVDTAINKLLDIVGIEEQYKLPEGKDEDFASKIGMINIPAQKLSTAYDITEVATSGELNGKKLSEEDKETMRIIAGIYGMYAMGTLPSDAGAVAQKAYYMIANKYKGRKKRGGKYF